MSISAHQSARPKTTTWITPPHIIDALGGARSFDLDPCAALKQPWPTAQSFFTEADDGLAHPWHGRIWLNPPYTSAEITQWMGRLANHGTGTALIFARTETRFFTESVFNQADGLLFLQGRLHFHYEDGSRAKANSGAPSVLVAYGAGDVERLAASDLEGTFLPLTLTGLVPVTPIEGTWAEELKKYMEGLNRPAHLSELYRAFATHRKRETNANYQAKIRQTLARGPFKANGDGQWDLL